MLLTCYGFTKEFFFGNLLKTIEVNKMLDLNKHETLVLTSLAFLVILFGFYPEPLIKTYATSIDNFINTFNVSTNLSLVEKTK